MSLPERVLMLLPNSLYQGIRGIREVPEALGYWPESDGPWTAFQGEQCGYRIAYLGGIVWVERLEEGRTYRPWLICSLSPNEARTVMVQARKATAPLAAPLDQRRKALPRRMHSRARWLAMAF